MKKFYSIIAIASLMLTSVLSFTSCQKDEMPSTMAKNQTIENPKPAVTPSTTTATSNSTSANGSSSADQATGFNYFGYQMFVNDEILALGDIVVTVKYDGKCDVYKASEGQTASVKSADFIDKYTSVMASACGIDTKSGKEVYSGKKLIVPTFQAGSHKASFTWEFIPNDAAIAALDAQSKTDAIVLIADMASKTNNIQLDVTDLANGYDVTNGSAYEKHYNRACQNQGIMISRISEFMTKKAKINSVEY